MRQAIVITLALVATTGCATMRAAATRSTEELLATAGFQVTAADTPETRAQLTALPPRQINRSTSQGQTTYVYPDPDVCRCLYVGTESQYEQYQRLQTERDIETERTIDTFGYWTPWTSSWR